MPAGLGVRRLFNIFLLFRPHSAGILIIAIVWVIESVCVRARYLKRVRDPRTILINKRRFIRWNSNRNDIFHRERTWTYEEGMAASEKGSVFFILNLPPARGSRMTEFNFLFSRRNGVIIKHAEVENN